MEKEFLALAETVRLVNCIPAWPGHYSCVFACPNCRSRLLRTQSAAGIYWVRVQHPLSGETLREFGLRLN